MDNNKSFNLILSGVGGQGLITLSQIIGQSGLLEDLQFRSSELHGLSQRGGSVRIHVRIGTEIESPLISPGQADLILALESQEALSTAGYASPNTSYLVNDYQTPTFGESVSTEQVMESLKKISSRVSLIAASDICQKELETKVVAGVFMLGQAFSKELLPFEKNSILKGIQIELPQKYWDLNLKAFELGQNY